MAIVWNFGGNFGKKIFGIFFLNSLGIGKWNCFWNSLGILGELFGNYLGIVLELFWDGWLGCFECVGVAFG